ncbi:MAG TPA: hypothetical protein VGR49_03750 [Actinomycetota bacterium]|nr:hypothetical protein [Actinomycetota bacterium]
MVEAATGGADGAAGEVVDGGCSPGVVGGAGPLGGAAGARSAPAVGASAFNRVPHSKQNTDVSAFSWSQFGQRMARRESTPGAAGFLQVA